MRLNFLYLIYTLFSALLALGVFITPYLAMHNSPSAYLLYNIYKPLCHQWAYRSYCLFPYGINACIKGNESVFLFTKYTQSTHAYDGYFHYSRDQIGKNRAEVVIREDGSIGYKFPVCARDTGFYIGMLLGALIYPSLFDEDTVFPWAFLFIAITPLAIDGFYQLFTTYESPLPFRFATGFSSGFLASLILIGNLITKLDRKE